MGTDRSEDHWLYRMCSRLCFRLPDFHYSHLGEIFVDRWVNQSDFRDLNSQCVDEWKSSLSWVSPHLVFLLD